MRYVEHLAIQRIYEIKQRELLPPFSLMLAMALSLHVVFLVFTRFAPAETPGELPFKTLNIRLGGGSGSLKSEGRGMPDALASQPATEARHALRDVTAEVARMPASATRTPARTPRVERTQAHPASASGMLASSQTGTANRQRGLAPAGPGSPYGSAGGTSVEAVRRYEQVMSYWIERHKMYPLQAQQAKMEGKVIVRLRIDRGGSVKLLRIERGSGSAMLDNAALEAIKAANPLPDVPANYPGGALLEFLVPIQFVLVD